MRLEEGLYSLRHTHFTPSKPFLTIGLSKRSFPVDSLEISERVWSYAWHHYESLDLVLLFKNITRVLKLIFWFWMQIPLLGETSLTCTIYSMFSFLIFCNKCVVTDSYTEVLEMLNIYLFILNPEFSWWIYCRRHHFFPPIIRSFFSFGKVFVDSYFL